MSDTDNVFREVDEELRNERMKRLWRQFGPYVIGVAVAIVLVVAGNELWNWWQKSNASRGAEQFTAALEVVADGDVAAAQQVLEDVAATAPGKYPVLAKFRAAALLAKDGKTQEAIAAYDALTTSVSDKSLRELSAIFAGYLLVDGGDALAVTQRVGDLNTDEHPMRNAAREAIGLAHYKAGELQEARTLFDQIAADPLAPRDLALRVSLYVGQLDALGIKAPAAEASE
jgi:hypothetical protein